MAIIIKRQSVEDFGEDRREVLTEVQQLITGGNMQMVSSYIISSSPLKYYSFLRSNKIS